MAGRGRGGGGAGRGRGRGGMSFNVEELGFGSGEALPGPVLQPPPLYPPLERQPVPLKCGSEIGYLLALKRDYIEYLKYSPAYILPTIKVKDIERYSDSKNVDTTNKSNSLPYDWKRYPMELRPLQRSKKKRLRSESSGIVSKKVGKLEDVTNKLEELEKQEAQGDSEEKNEENKDEKEKEDHQEEEVEEEDQDEEMDDGTDYVNNYFDNGESYLDDEDDNLDDGPVY